MADVYLDPSASGANDGTSWTDAYQNWATALDGANTVAGDRLFVKGTESPGATITLSGGTQANPIIILGCKSATTATPPTQSDLIPGWATGETQTIANRAHEDGDMPQVNVTGDLDLDFYAYIYAVKLNSTSIIRANNSAESGLIFVECWFDEDIRGPDDSAANVWLYKNCKFAKDFNNIDGGYWEIIGGYWSTASALTLVTPSRTFDFRCIGSDLSDRAHTLFSVAGDAYSNVIFRNCKLNASTAVVTGSSAGGYRIEVHQCDSTTGKSSGTILTIDIATESGNIAEETTAVRTGGANDGSSNWSFAFTPTANATQDNYVGLIGPWMAFKVTGDGTSQTVTVYIANSGAADYNDDDVWLEVMYPSESGTAQYDSQTTQMDLLGTPAAVTDDTDSTWGSGGNNPQKLEASIAPDYVGRAYCRVVFAKNFSSSPETLYVDPLPTVA